MSRREFASTPSWLKVVALLGLITTVVVAWHVGIRAALMTGGIALVAWGADRVLPQEETPGPGREESARMRPEAE